MEFQNFYEHLVPAEILLDVFSFTTGIELSGFKKMHKYFGDIIDCYTKSLPLMTIQKLDIVMDYDKYLDKIVMKQSANRVIQFDNFKQLIEFLRAHPMPINEIILWNTIYISKSLLTIAKEVQIGRVKIQHNSKSRFYEYSAQGQIVLKGNVHQNRELSINVLMEDYMHFIKTVHKNRHWRALHFSPPNNFECSYIQFCAEQGVEYSSKELIDWVVENEMHGRPLIVEHCSFDKTFPGIICSIFKEITDNPSIRPFTLLFKQIARTPDQPMQTTIVKQPNGMKFLAGLLHFDEQCKEYFLIGQGGQKEIVVMPDGIDDDEEKEEDKVEKDDEDDEKEEEEEKSGKRFDGIIQYIGIGDWMDMCAAGPSTSAAAGIY